MSAISYVGVALQGEIRKKGSFTVSLFDELWHVSMAIRLYDYRDLIKRSVLLVLHYRRYAYRR